MIMWMWDRIINKYSGLFLLFMRGCLKICFNDLQLNLVLQIDWLGTPFFFLVKFVLHGSGEAVQCVNTFFVIKSVVGTWTSADKTPTQTLPLSETFHKNKNRENQSGETKPGTELAAGIFLIFGNFWDLSVQNIIVRKRWVREEIGNLSAILLNFHFTALTISMMELRLFCLYPPTLCCFLVFKVG